MAERFYDWLAGFIDGEGCFIIRETKGDGRYYCGFHLEVRLDDAKIIRDIHSTTGIGSLKTRYRAGARGNDCPQISWNVQSGRDCAKLAMILDEHPLRAKKATDYAIWRTALNEQFSPTRDWALMNVLRQQLSANKKYEGGELVALPKPAPQLKLLIS